MEEESGERKRERKGGKGREGERGKQRECSNLLVSFFVAANDKVLFFSSTPLYIYIPHLLYPFICLFCFFNFMEGVPVVDQWKQI